MAGAADTAPRRRAATFSRSELVDKIRSTNFVGFLNDSPRPSILIRSSPRHFPQLYKSIFKCSVNLWEIQGCNSSIRRRWSSISQIIWSVLFPLLSVRSHTDIFQCLIACKDYRIKVAYQELRSTSSQPAVDGFKTISSQQIMEV